uniref:Uncharacterized protein n=1 Tax=Cajanus cajan TaxID=3821 RepID=A0A151S3J1_CAJCA|nr:hypothetical protein KK1_028938 [Cajanus cajan]
MAGRGRGRGGWGRGRGGGGGFTFAAQVPFDPFPEDVTLPEVKIGDIDASTKKLLIWSYKLQNYWKASPYHLEERTSKKRQRMHIARFSDKKGNDFTRDSLSQVLMFKEFPQELVQGASKQTSRRKKFRWNPECNKLLQSQFDTSTTSSASFTSPTTIATIIALLQRLPSPLPLYTNTIIDVTTSANHINTAPTTEPSILLSLHPGKEDVDENEKKDGEDEEDENAEEEDDDDISEDDYHQVPL